MAISAPRDGIRSDFTCRDPKLKRLSQPIDCNKTMTSSGKHQPIADSSRLNGMSLDRIRAVAFDAVGTVMYPSPSVAEAYGAVIRRHLGIEVSQDTVSKTVQNALLQRSATKDLRTSESTEHEFWANLVRQFCGAADGFDACFAELFAHFGNAKNWSCFDDVQAAVLQLQESGLLCAVASNFDLRLNSVCDGLPPVSSVDHRVISSTVGWRKPAPQFFAAIADCLQLAPDEILMVGDDLNNDVLGAVAAGMPAVWLCRTDVPPVTLPQNAIRVSDLSELTDLLSNHRTLTTPQKTEQQRG